MKPAAHRSKPAAYPWRTELQTRFGDLDVLGHLNNVAIARLHEEARSRFVMAHLSDSNWRTRGWVSLAANVNLHYLGEAFYPEATTISVGVERIGSRSYVIGSALFQKGVCLGTCDCTLVVVSTSTRQPQPIPPSLRLALEKVCIGAPAPCEGVDP